MNHLLLHLLLRHSGRALCQRKIQSIRYLKPLLTIELGPGRGTCFLVLLLGGPGPFCFTTDVDPLEGKGEQVLQRIVGERARKASLAPNDRVIRLELGADEGGPALLLYLFGSSAKVRIEHGGTIVESLDPRENGQPLPLGPAQDEELATISRERLAGVLLGSGRQRVPGLAPEMIDGFKLSSGQVDIDALVQFRDGLLNETESFLLASAASLARVVPLPKVFPGRAAFAHLHGPFDDAEGACRFVGEELSRAARAKIIARYTAPLRKRAESRQKLLARLEHELDEAEGFDTARNEANILVAFRSRVPHGSREVELPNLYAPGETVRIELDPSAPLQEQIERRFKHATKLERSLGTLRNRIKAVDDEIVQVANRLAEVAAESTFAGTLDMLEATAWEIGLRRPAPAKKAPRQEAPGYRRFDIDPQWFVLVGRSDQENDEITFHVAKPDDVWLHAQHVAGSHVVLKPRGGAPGNPPARVLEVAASIAAHFSKSKHASLVPVICTRRKYVRKFRGAKPGQVRCEREKTVFAEPKLPNSVQ